MRTFVFGALEKDMEGHWLALRIFLSGSLDSSLSPSLSHIPSIAEGAFGGISAAY